MTHSFKIGALLFLVISQLSSTALASGNHPDAGACPKDKPYYAICTHSLHSLEGWFSNQCRADKASAQRDAEAHAKKYHDGNMRWTGVNQLR